jgi:hypothetical protein
MHRSPPGRGKGWVSQWRYRLTHPALRAPLPGGDLLHFDSELCVDGGRFGMGMKGAIGWVWGRAIAEVEVRLRSQN